MEEWNFQTFASAGDQPIEATSHWTSCPRSYRRTGAGDALPWQWHQISAPVSLLRSSPFVSNPHTSTTPRAQPYKTQNPTPIRHFPYQADQNPQCLIGKVQIERIKGEGGRFKELTKYSDGGGGCELWSRAEDIGGSVMRNGSMNEALKYFEVGRRRWGVVWHVRCETTT